MKDEIEITYLRPPSRRYTFSTEKIANWVRNNTASSGKVLNLFAGRTRLFDYFMSIDEIRIDIDESVNPTFVIDAYEYVNKAIRENIKFNTIILDPPYTHRKAMEKYNGRHISSFNKIVELVPQIIFNGGNVITCGYNSVVMGKSRGFKVKSICLISHGGAHHDTIITNEIFNKKEYIKND